MEWEIHVYKYESVSLYKYFDIYLTIFHAWGSANTSTNIQSTLVISKSKGPSKTLRDTCTSIYRICSIEEKTIWTTKFYK